MNCPESIEIEGSSCLIIDGNAIMVAIGKPQEAKTFGDLAVDFMGVVMHYGIACQQIHVTFNKYWTDHIKSATIETGKRHPIRRVIDDRDVPLPLNWNNFLALLKTR